MTTFTVKPREPTVLDGQSHYVLADIDLMGGFKVDTAYIVPGAIDLDRFKDALARTLSVYPVHAGRIERPKTSGEPWKVRLTNDPVEVVVIQSDAETEVPTNAVVQGPWTLTRGVNIVKYLDHDNDEPVMRVTIIQFTKTGSTSIGLSCSHLIGDGFVNLAFARLLSQNYQGLPPLDPAPSYAPTPATPFDPAQYGDIPMPEFVHFYNLRGVPPHLEPGRKKPQRVDIRLTASQIAQLNKGILAQCPDAAPPILSRQDTLVGLLTYCLSKADPETEPIQHVATILMSRGLPPRPANSIGNNLLWATTDAAPDFSKETPYTIALRVRKALVRLRDPGFAAAYEALQAQKARAAIDADLAQDFIQRPGHMVVNSTWRFDWTSAHFGFPGQTRFFHTLLDEPRFVKMFQPNPTRLPDGTWRTRPGDVEITFYAHAEVKAAFKELFKAEARTLGADGDIEFVD